MFRTKIISLLSSLLLLSACAPEAAPEPTFIPTPPPTATSTPTPTPTNTPLPTDTPTPSPTPTPEASLTKEMQDMGLRLEEDEDGRWAAVDERGYMRFYEKDGEWVDWYQELIDGATRDFWWEYGEFMLPGGVDAKRTNIEPVWTGEVEEISMVMDGVNVNILTLVSVITDPVKPGIIREVLVPIEYSSLNGEIVEGPHLWTTDGDIWSEEDVLSELSPGDQFFIDMYTRVFHRHPVCTLENQCGPAIIINETQELTDLFTQVFDNYDSSQWPDRIIIPALVVKIYL